MIVADAKRVCILWAMGVTQHTRAPTRRRRSRTCCSSPATTCGRAPAPIRCAVTTTCRARAITGRCRTRCPATSRSTIPEVRARFEAAWGVTLPTTKGLDNHEMVDAIHQGKLKAMYLIGEEMSIVDSNANYVQRRIREARVLRRAGHLLQRDLPVRRRRAAGRSEPGKGRHLHQHRAANSAALPGVRAARRDAGPTGRSSRMSRTSLGADWNYRHPSEVMDEIASLTPLFAGVNYDRLEGYKSLQWPVAADGTDQPLLYTEAFRVSGRQGEAVPAGVDRTDRAARRGVRSAPEQRPSARALPRGQPDLSRRRHPREDARHVRRGLAGTGRGARHPERNVGRADLALRPGSRAGAGDRSRARARTLHADELGRESR